MNEKEPKINPNTQKWTKNYKRTKNRPKTTKEPKIEHNKKKKQK